MAAPSTQQTLEETALVVQYLNETTQTIHQNQTQLAQTLKQLINHIPQQISTSAQLTQNKVIQTITQQLDHSLNQRLALIDKRHSDIAHQQEQLLSQLNATLKAANRSAGFLVTKNIALLAATLGLLLSGAAFLIWHNASNIIQQNQTLVDIELHKKIKFNNCNGSPCKVTDKAYKKGDVMDPPYVRLVVASKFPKRGQNETIYLHTSI